MKNVAYWVVCFLNSALLSQAAEPIWKLGTASDTMPKMELVRAEVMPADDHGDGIEFRGLGSRVILHDVPNFTSKGASTVSLFCRCDELPEVRNDGSLGAGPLLSWDYKVLLRVYSSGELYGGMTNEAGKLVGTFSNTKVTAGSWHHIALTFSTADQLMRLYLDGSVVAEAKGDLGKLAALPPSSLVLGSDPDGSDFLGMVADVKIYDTALTQEDIDKLANTVSGVAP